MKSILFFGIFWITSLAVAKDQAGKKLIVETIHGDLHSQFTIENSKLALHQSNGYKKSRPLTKADFEFVFKEYSRLPKARNPSADCYRTKISIVLFVNGLPTQKKASCFGMKTSAEPAYARFTNILLTNF